MFLYEKIARDIQGKIESGAIRAGERLDSVRELSKRYNISLSTSFKTYEELVNRSIVEARPKSGYFARLQKQHLPDITLSKSRLELKTYSTDRIIAYASNRLSNDKIVQLSISAPHISLLPQAKLNKSMKEALNLSTDSCLKYESIPGNPELRRQIVRHTISGGTADPDDLVITQGCIESIFLSLMTVTKPGDTVIIQRPSYFGIYGIIRNLRLKIIEIDVHPEHGLDYLQLEQCIKKVKVSACILVTNFNNPTGHCIPDEVKERIVRILARKNIPLIEDDIYGEIYFGSARPETCKNFDKKGLVMLCSSISKTLAPGYRIGWCLPGKFKSRFLDIKLMHTFATASPTQFASAVFFRTGRYDLHMKKLRKTLHIESLKYLEIISSYFPQGTRVTSPKGGFVLWIELPGKIDSIKLFYEVMDLGISIWPGPVFSPSGGFRNFIRLSFGEPMNESVESSIKLIGEKCHELMGYKKERSIAKTIEASN